MSNINRDSINIKKKNDGKKKNNMSTKPKTKKLFHCQSYTSLTPRAGIRF